jgi:hypothetical protein
LVDARRLLATVEDKRAAEELKNQTLNVQLDTEEAALKAERATLERDRIKREKQRKIDKATATANAAIKKEEFRQQEVNNRLEEIKKELKTLNETESALKKRVEDAQAGHQQEDS